MLALVVCLIAADIGYSEKIARWPYAEYGATLNEEKRDSLLDSCYSSTRIKRWFFEVSDASECSSFVGFPLSFLKSVDFRGTIFDSIGIFSFADFSDKVSFWSAKFQSGASFLSATFDSSSSVGFILTDFSDVVLFSNAEFMGGVGFIATTFDSSSLVSFNGADFSDTVIFSAEFHGGANFANVIFDSSSLVDFLFAKFSDDVSFEEAKFQGRVNFLEVTFEKGASFSRAILGNSFHGRDSSFVDFSGGSTRGDLNFNSARI